MKTFICILVVLSFFLTECTRKTYGIVVKFKTETTQDEYFPIFFDQRFIGSSDQVRRSKNDSKCLEVNIPDSIKIPKNSQFLIGYVDFLGSRGMSIRPSDFADDLKAGD